MGERLLTANDLDLVLKIGRRMKGCGIKNFENSRITNMVFADFNRLMKVLVKASETDSNFWLNLWIKFYSVYYGKYDEPINIRRESRQSGKFLKEHWDYAKGGATESIKSITSHGSPEGLYEHEKILNGKFSVAVSPMASGPPLLCLVFTQARLQGFNPPKVVPALVDLNQERVKLPPFWKMPWQNAVFIDDIIDKETTCKLTLRAMGS